MDRRRLLDARAELISGIRASEEWQPSYKADPALFRMLTKAEATLETEVAEYFHGLSQRAVFFVDWTQMPISLQADATPSKGDLVWQIEAETLQAAIIDAITELIATGGQAGEKAYGFDLGIGTLDQAVMKAARTQTGQLVSGITDTTRDLVKEAVQQSITRGEDVDVAQARLRKIINNPVRAELIARTESVNGYQLGLRNFADRTGATTKTWESIAGACQICSPTNGQTVGIAEQFTLGNGNQVDQPSAHPRCRCGVIYNY